MIVTKTGFGVYLTDEFGSAINGRGEMLAQCEGLAYEDKGWLFGCPSAEEYQFVLGFGTDPDKSVNVAELEQRWKECLASAPEGMVSAWEKAGRPEPDFVFLAGHC